MATLTLKNIPESLLEQLRKRASDDRRSLNQEVLHLLEQTLIAAEEARQPKEAWQRQVDAWRRIAGRWRSQQTVADEIQQIYAARTRGRDVTL